MIIIDSGKTLDPGCIWGKSISFGSRWARIIRLDTYCPFFWQKITKFRAKLESGEFVDCVKSSTRIKGVQRSGPRPAIVVIVQAAPNVMASLVNLRWGRIDNYHDKKWWEK